jgi:hypothetical protein
LAWGFTESSRLIRPISQLEQAVALDRVVAPQPVFRTRIRDGVIQVCLPEAG